MQIIVLINAPNRSYSQGGCPIFRGNYFTGHVFYHFTEQVEQNFFEQISFTGSLKKQLVQPKLPDPNGSISQDEQLLKQIEKGYRTDRFSRRKTLTEHVFHRTDPLAAAFVI